MCLLQLQVHFFPFVLNLLANFIVVVVFSALKPAKRITDGLFLKFKSIDFVPSKTTNSSLKIFTNCSPGLIDFKTFTP